MEAQDARALGEERERSCVCACACAGRETTCRPEAQEMVCMLLGTVGFHQAAAETREINSSKY